MNGIRCPKKPALSLPDLAGKRRGDHVHHRNGENFVSAGIEQANGVPPAVSACWQGPYPDNRYRDKSHSLSIGNVTWTGMGLLQKFGIPGAWRRMVQMKEVHIQEWRETAVPYSVRIKRRIVPSAMRARFSKKAACHQGISLSGKAWMEPEGIRRKPQKDM